MPRRITIEPPPDTPLAVVYTTWRKELRLSPAEVANASGLARNTLHLIATGQTHQPNRQTLDRLARGLARNPLPPYRREPDLEQQIRRELYHAAGYAQPDGGDPMAPLLETALTATLGSRRLARVWIERIGELSGLEADEVRRLGVGATTTDA